MCPQCLLISEGLDAVSLALNATSLTIDCTTHNKSCSEDASDLAFSAATFVGGELLSKAAEGASEASVEFIDSIKAEIAAVSYGTKVAVNAAHGKMELPE